MVCLMMQHLAYFTGLAREQRLQGLKALSVAAEGSCLTDSSVRPCVKVHLRPSAGEAASVFALVQT